MSNTTIFAEITDMDQLHRPFEICQRMIASRTKRGRMITQTAL
jgi:Holliday junction resolvasome RuvABC ATP-dependent DNA helicase subunit